MATQSAELCRVQVVMSDDEGGLLQGRDAVAISQGDYQLAIVMAEVLGDAMNA